MSLQTIASQFVELCNHGKNFDVMHAMYAPDIVSVEPNGEETASKTLVIQKSERFQAQNPISGEKVRGPFFNGPKQITVEEVGVYTVKDNKITREQFFNEGTR
jgi:hypothetical protein